MQHNFEGLDRPGGVARVGLLRPLRSRDFRFLWAGMTVSLVGDGVFLVAIAWTAYSLWNTPAALSIVGIAMTVPTIACLLFGGVISDRLDRRRILLYADLSRALVVGVLAALALADALTFAGLVVIVAAYGIGAAFFIPAFESIVPAIVDPAELPQANALDQFVRPIALRLVGPALGGALIGLVGVGSAFALDAGSFLVSAITVLGLRPAGVAQPASASTIAAVTDGLRFVRSNVWLWGTLLSAAIAYLAFLGPTEALLPFVVKNTLHGSASELGLVFAAGGVGAVGAALVMGQRGQPRRDMTCIYVCWTVATLAVVGYGVARTVPQLMVACLAFNALEAAGTIMWSTVKQRHVPAGLLGRVSSLDWLISISLLPISFAITGPVAGLIGVRATLVGAGLVGAAATLSALFIPGMRSVEGSVASGSAAATATSAAV
jgi:DHA3 family tetracycline resistance protein-like MFS transporter